MKRPHSKIEIAYWIAGVVVALLALLAYFKTEVKQTPASNTSDGGTLTLQGHSNTVQNSTIVQGSNNSVSVGAPGERAPSDLEKLLYGRWQGTMRQTAPNVELITTGYMRLLETGSYSSSGDLLFRGLSQDQPFELTFTVVATGTWRLVGNTFFVKLLDLKAAPKLLRQRGKADIDLSNPSTLPAHLLPKLEDMMPKGAEQPYELVELTKSKLSAVGTDTGGAAIRYEASRALQ